MAMIGEVATTHPVSVLTTTRVDDAARFMAEYGIGDVIVTDPDSGKVVGMLTDRDVTVRLVAHNRDAQGTEVHEIYTPNATTVTAEAGVDTAVDLMQRHSIRRLPVVDDDGKPVGMVSLEDLASSGHIGDESVRAVLKSLADAYREKRVSGAS